MAGRPGHALPVVGRGVRAGLLPLGEHLGEQQLTVGCICSLGSGQGMAGQPLHQPHVLEVVVRTTYTTSSSLVARSPVALLGD